MRPTIGIAVPCYVNHSVHIEGLLRNIAASSEKPDRIVISCSSWTRTNDVVFIFEGIPVEILYTTRVLNAAQNRNRAAKRLTTDLISFFDADDLMHPKRIEYIRGAFENRLDISALYHGYSYDHASKRHDPFWEVGPANLLPNKLVKDPKAVGIMALTDPPNQFEHHHAHVTVRSDIFSHFMFPEHPQYTRLEDSVYGALLVASNVPMAFLSNVLSRYIFGN